MMEWEEKWKVAGKQKVAAAAAAAVEGRGGSRERLGFDGGKMKTLQFYQID